MILAIVQPLTVLLYGHWNKDLSSRLRRYIYVAPFYLERGFTLISNQSTYQLTLRYVCAQDHNRTCARGMIDIEYVNRQGLRHSVQAAVDRDPRQQ